LLQEFQNGLKISHRSSDTIVVRFTYEQNYRTMILSQGIEAERFYRTITRGYSRSGMFEIEERSEGTNVIRWINTGRIPLYIFVIWIQFSKYQLCISGSSSSCDIMIIFVPLFLMLLDVVLVAESSHNSSGFKAFAFMVSFLSLSIAIHTLQPYITILSGYMHSFASDDVAMFELALSVAILSFIEIIWFINEMRPRTGKEEYEWEGAIRTY
jgi:hypothetical protein